MKMPGVIGRLSAQWRRHANAVFHREFAVWLWRRIWLDDIPGRAAQLSYYFLLSFFPLLICVSALIGVLFASGSRAERHLLAYFGSLMPSAAFNIVRQTADDLLRSGGGGKLSFGLLVALWLASSGMEAVVEGLSVAFQISDSRPWWKRRLSALGLTITAAALMGCALGMALAGSAGGRLLMDLAGLGGLWGPFWRVVQWIASLVFLLIAIALVYKFGPDERGRERDLIVAPGAVVALLCWIATSLGLRLYLDHWGALGRTYGSLGAVIALLVWLYATGATLLLGAEINSGIQARERRQRPVAKPAIAR
jgi:membrane protein